MRGRLAAVVLAVAGAFAIAGCHETTDSLGYQGADGGLTLHPLHGPATYPNVLVDVLGMSESTVSGAVTNAFNTLFHGDPTKYAIYSTVGTDQAMIVDTLHGNDVRTEGMGLGMLICVELMKRDEFDRLWRYSKANLQIQSGPNKGYFQSDCDGTAGNIPCLDPYGMEEYVMALIFAHDQWGGMLQDIDYGADALALLDVMRHKEDQNGGIVYGDAGSVGVTNVFDQTTALAYDIPDTSAAGNTRPAIPKPAYYDLWAQAIADPFWTRAAGAARAYWQRAANPTTGFLPTRATFDGFPVPGSSTYEPSAYRAQVNMAFDWVWSGGSASAWEVKEANTLLAFLSSQGINTYGKIYTLGGQVVDSTRDMGAIAINGMTAMVSSAPDRAAYMQATWNNQSPMGDGRYFVGLFELVSLMVLGGMMHVI